MAEQEKQPAIEEVADVGDRRGPEIQSAELMTVRHHEGRQIFHYLRLVTAMGTVNFTIAPPLADELIQILQAGQNNALLLEKAP